MKRPTLWQVTLAGLTFSLVSAPALADVPSLQVAPLSYHGTLHAGTVVSGFVDVSNPSDEAIQITSNVQGFRQVDPKGDLAFYSDPVLTAGITVSLANFQLGPRQAVRDVFNIDPSKLPQGGIYAAIFFRTVPVSAASSNNSYVLQSANVGTLLILTNGHASPYRGTITGLSVPGIQLGNGLDGSLSYKNTNQSLTAAGFTPSLTDTIYPWGRAAGVQSGLILPGVTRDFSFARPGSFFGFLPVTVTDSQTGAHATAWVLADTGLYRPGVPVAIVALVILFMWLRPYVVRTRREFVIWLSKVTKRKPEPAIMPVLDGLTKPPAIDALPDETDENPESPVTEPNAVPEETQTVLEELTATDQEADAGLDLQDNQPSPPATKIKVKSESAKTNRKSEKATKTKSKRRPGRPKKSDS